MRRMLVLYSIGFAAVLFFSLLASVAVGIVAAEAGWEHLRIALGPLLILQAGSSPTSDTFSVGPGLPALAALLAGLNTLGGVALGRRHDPSAPPQG
jgi:hypothetical protein